MEGHMKAKCRIVSAALFVLALSVSSVHGQTTVPEHFRRERGFTRVENVDVSVRAFSSLAADQILSGKRPESAQRMRLDFFPDVSVVVTFDHIERQSADVQAWSGKVEGFPNGS